MSVSSVGSSSASVAATRNPNSRQIAVVKKAAQIERRQTQALSREIERAAKSSRSRDASGPRGRNLDVVA